MDITSLSTEELKAELERRKQVEYMAKLKRNKLVQNDLIAARPFILPLLKHVGRSCNDVNPYNGINQHGTICCPRCFLLDELDCLEPDIEVSIDISISRTIK